VWKEKASKRRRPREQRPTAKRQLEVVANGFAEGTKLRSRES
jgi:hypothetical protein